MDFDEVKRLIEEFFNGKFEVKKFLGEGSFAKVYLVNHNYLDTLMAMKIVKEPLSLSTNRKDVFREVTLACHLRHENIISIYDAAEITDFEDGKNHAYFVMEYVSGGDLGQFLNSFVANDMFMPIERSLDLIRQILLGLNTLHSANPPIIHRDLKPNNVLLSFNACGEIIIKISDFGFAKEVTTSISDIDVAGTRPYMAPELFDRNVSARSDIYAVGVMFYQLLTNRYPYDVERYTNEELINLEPWKEELKPPSHYNNLVFDELDQIVLKCLEMDSANRYRDARDLLRDVYKAIDKHRSIQIVPKDNLGSDYRDEYSEYVVNDSIIEAFRLAKCENKLPDAIEILEGEVLRDYDVRKCYSEILRIWKSKRPDLKLISKAFTVNLKGRNYDVSCNFLKEAIAYNPSLKIKYQHYIDLWEMFIDLESHGSLYNAVVMLESLMESSSEIERLYAGILPALKSYSVEEIVVEAVRLVNSNNLSDGANLMEFAVVCDAKIRQKYAYKLSLWKQNMRMHFKQPSEIKENTIDYAIDLGTTDSVISYFNKGNPIIIKNHRTGDDFTPSAVLIDGQDNVEVGANARNAIFENSRNAVSEFKHNMGFSIPFKFENSSRILYPEELSAEVLKDLRVSVFNQRGVNIEHAVICVPANSNPIKTRAINDAAELAGFRSHSLILEPIAVSLAYNVKKDNGIWMVYDLGGGTFNVTLIQDNDGEIEKLATDGVENLGGNAFDWKVVNDLFRPKISYDLNLDDFRRDNPRYLKTFAKLKNAAEIAKKDLTESEAADISIDNLFDGYDFRYKLTRHEFGEIIESLIKYTLKLSRDLLDENSLCDEDIDGILLAGGSSLSPIVREAISKEFAIEIESSINPAAVVSIGAAIYAGSLEKPQFDVKREPISVILNRENDEIIGKVFSLDSKFSFLGFSIGFENDGEEIRIPLAIDGKFKVKLSHGSFGIRLYKGNTGVVLDEKSPDEIEADDIHIPYLNKSFKVNDDMITLRDILARYIKLINDIEYLKDYSYEMDTQILEYVERLIEISKRNPMAFNQTNIYLEYLGNVVDERKRDLEFSVLEKNVLEKIEVIRNNDLFAIEGIEEVLESEDLDKLKEFYGNLVEKYVMLNRNSVIEDVFYNLKYEGIYTDKNISEELIEKAHSALANHDYDGLLGVVNLLYELDERLIK